MIVTRSRQVEKTLKKIGTSGRKGLLRVFVEVVDLLSVYDHDAQSALCIRFRDHALTGNLSDMRELHLDQDVLLLYKIHAPHVIELRDIITHEELRKRK